ncbi:hypothetical protein [Actinopolymorpha singaporensis]|uniref:Uncharacterized protein n=1 Tax=Actinopolymorpha singaporensis TaxID=117157 RepID=A0A1H1YT98_9ACTN|nr:hypothetical protein [Actinopolymorpha singaporensis]SDT24509.1 hypothetical protein SAMN04489717_5677 [Actinopolymorpha singaporensis]
MGEAERAEHAGQAEAERADSGGAVRTALVEEACRRSSVLWLDYAGLDRPRPAWHVWSEGAAYVVAENPTAAAEQPEEAENPRHLARTERTGQPDHPVARPEQALPGLAEVTEATVTCRSKDSGARLVTWRADVRRLRPGTQEWDDAVLLLRGDRLNATDAADLPARWARTAVIVRLAPSGEVLEEPGRMPGDRAAASPPGSPATTTGRLPWVVHKRPRHRPRLS